MSCISFNRLPNRLVWDDDIIEWEPPTQNWKVKWKSTFYLKKQEKHIERLFEWRYLTKSIKKSLRWLWNKTNKNALRWLCLFVYLSIVLDKNDVICLVSRLNFSVFHFKDIAQRKKSIHRAQKTFQSCSKFTSRIFRISQIFWIQRSTNFSILLNKMSSFSYKAFASFQRCIKILVKFINCFVIMWNENKNGLLNFLPSKIFSDEDWRKNYNK